MTLRNRILRLAAGTALGVALGVGPVWLAAAAQPAAQEPAAVASGGSGGKALRVDLDGDGVDDLYSIAPGRDDLAFLQRGDRLYEVTVRAALHKQSGTVLAHPVDLDGRRPLDLALLKEDGRLVLMQNLGGHFQDVSKDKTFQQTAAATSLSVGGTSFTLGSLAHAQIALRCSPGLRDTAVSGACLEASSAPELGKLYPQSVDFNLTLADAALSGPARTVEGSVLLEQLGWSVAAAGDVNNDGIEDSIVGSPFDDTLISSGGKATVYSGADGSVLHTFLGDDFKANLGWSVDGAGDVNGDGYADLLVGEPHRTAGSGQPGFAFVYSGVDGSLLFTLAGDGARDKFGWSVAGAGDVDGDGTPDLLVGAPSIDFSPQIGYARLHSGADGSTLLTLDGQTLNDHFGYSVDAAGDVDGDGTTDLVVGAPREASAAGQTRVFSGADGSLLHQFQGSSGNDFLGFSVAGAGDVNGDGRGDVIAGAPFSANGYARVYSGADGSILHDVAGSASGDGAGVAVKGAGDLDSDGKADFMIGATQGSADPGYLRAYSGASGAVLFDLVGEVAGDELGFSMDRVADSLLVGAPGHDLDPSTVEVGKALTFSTLSVGMGTTSPGERLTVAGVVASNLGGLRFPDGTVQADDRQGPTGDPGPQGPAGPQGPTGPPATSGLLTLNGLDVPAVTLVGTDAFSVSAAGSTVTLKIGSATCTEGSKTYSEGAVCYLAPTLCPTGFGFRAQRKVCQSDGTWQIITSTQCFEPSPGPRCGF